MLRRAFLFRWDDLQRCCNSKEVLVENLKKSADEKEEIFQKKLKICNEQNEALSFQLKQYQLKYFNNEEVLETKLLRYLKIVFVTF